MKKYPSIEQLRNIIRAVKTHHDYQGKDENGDNIYKHVSPYPILKFRGTIKLHGTNASVVKYKNSENLVFQSRENELSISQDNAGFRTEMIVKNLNFLFERFQFNDYIAVYGEWCGGNIQKGVAINGLPKMFVIFGIKIDDNWVELPHDLHDNSQLIYNINQFETYEIEIDFNNPELSVPKIIELTTSVENECPVGKYFGKSGVGEGIVFQCITNKSLIFKSKGEKHSSSKVKTVAPVDIELINSINEFCEYAVTENRLQQGYDILVNSGQSTEMENIGTFIRWVVNDVVKEESDVMEQNKLNLKNVSKQISTIARNWYINKL